MTRPFFQHFVRFDRLWDFWVRVGRFEVHLWRQNLGVHLAFHWRTT